MTKTLRLAFVVGFALAVAGACGSKDEGGGAPAIVDCTPGNNVVCLCKSGDYGTHECLRDGHTFGPCEPCLVDVEDTGSPPPPHDGGASETSRGGDASGDAGDVIAPDVGPGDVCPGTPVAVDPGKTVEVSGDTSGGAVDTYGASGDCAPGYLGHAVAYEVTPSATGTLSAEIIPAISFDAIVYAAEASCTTGGVVACLGPKGAGTIGTTTFHVEAGTSYYVFVEGNGGSTGTYSLRLNLVTPYCGDGNVDPGEDCDDDNAIDGDGCDSACHVVGDPPTAGKCPGLAVHVWSSSVNVTGSTTPYKNGYWGSCGGNTAPERPYAVTPHVSGKLTAFLDPAVTDFDAVVYARQDPCATGTELACSDVPGSGGDSVTIDVIDGTTYYILVDGYAGANGNFKLTLSVTP